MAKTRDLSEKEFRVAAARNGFDISPMGTHLYEPKLGIGYGAVFSRQGRGGVKIHFREWLARAIQQREKDRKKRDERKAVAQTNN
jgi:hypothetical protein